MFDISDATDIKLVSSLKRGQDPLWWGGFGFVDGNVAFADGDERLARNCGFIEEASGTLFSTLRRSIRLGTRPTIRVVEARRPSRRQIQPGNGDFVGIKVGTALVILLVSSSLSGCAVPFFKKDIRIAHSEKTTEERNQYPESDADTRARIGDRVAELEVTFVTPAVRVTHSAQFGKSEGEMSIQTCAVTVDAGEWAFDGTYSAEEIVADCFGPVKFRKTHSDGSANWWGCSGHTYIRHICHQSDGKFFALLEVGRWYLEQDQDKLELFNKSVNADHAFREVLHYERRTGSKLVFKYQKFSGESDRAVLTREIEHDLRNGAVVAVGTWRVNIVDAGENEIRYRVTISQ